MSLNHFYTYCDKNYLCRGLALYHSLMHFTKNFELFVLCLDEETYHIFKKNQYVNIIPIKIEQLEKFDLELLSKKNSRSSVEYYFTCTAALGCYIFEHYEQVQFLTYLDADTFFFSSPIAFLEDLKNVSVAITPHRFPKTKLAHEKFGIYNVGWVSFKRDEDGMKCLSDWRKDCLEWCHAYWDNERYGDQKYLDKWPEKYGNVKVIEHHGINAGPWNLEEAVITYENNFLSINGVPLILYHFHNLSRLLNRVYRIGLVEYSVKINSVIRKQLYLKYIKEVNKLHIQLNNSALPRFGISQKKLLIRNFWPINDLLVAY